jgi:uroporphyrinogen decarboxylase
MTERERFLATFAGEATDGPPLWEEGVQEETLAAWRQQGMPPGETPETRFRFDRREMVEVNLEPHPAAPNPTGCLARLREGYGADGDSRLPADWSKRVADWGTRDYPLGIPVSRGLFRSLGIEDWGTLTSVLYALCDEPGEVEATMECATELSLRVLKRVVAQVTLDFAIFNEPVASFHAPVVSPAHYRRFVMSHLQRLVTALRAAGVPVLIVQAYGQVEPLIPLWREVGIHTLWCYHAQPAGIDYRALRRRYGSDLRLIGGIPTAALRQGPGAIEEALARVVVPLLAEGGYLPMLDDRVRETVPYDNYCYYRTRLEQLVAKR